MLKKRRCFKKVINKYISKIVKKILHEERDFLKKILKGEMIE